MKGSCAGVFPEFEKHPEKVMGNQWGYFSGVLEKLKYGRKKRGTGILEI